MKFFLSCSFLVISTSVLSFSFGFLAYDHIECSFILVVTNLYFRLCVVCVGPSHPLVTDSSIEIKSIDFKNDKFDHSKNEVHGKRKSKYSPRG